MNAEYAVALFVRALLKAIGDIPDRHNGYLTKEDLADAIDQAINATGLKRLPS